MAELSVKSTVRQLTSASLLLLCSFILGCSDAPETPPTGTTESEETTTDEPADSAPTETTAESAETTESPQRITLLELEKDALKFGFVKLTDCDRIVVAKEKGFLEDEGLEVEVIAQPDWKLLLNNVATGEPDGARMLSGQSMAATALS